MSENSCSECTPEEYCVRHIPSPSKMLRRQRDLAWTKSNRLHRLYLGYKKRWEESSLKIVTNLFKLAKAEVDLKDAHGQLESLRAKVNRLEARGISDMQHEIAELKFLARIARDALWALHEHGSKPPYDWNSDPLWLTRVIGDLSQKTESPMQSGKDASAEALKVSVALKEGP